jgi:hypothetical protein
VKFEFDAAASYQRYHFGAAPSYRDSVLDAAAVYQQLVPGCNLQSCSQGQHVASRGNAATTQLGCSGLPNSDSPWRRGSAQVKLSAAASCRAKRPSVTNQARRSALPSIFAATRLSTEHEQHEIHPVYVGVFVRHAPHAIHFQSFQSEKARSRVFICIAVLI